ncbi:RNA polymerase sigma factor [Streptomyces sp. LS1784]|uniref:RNA polymerase sigma factor n=2 Tax=Streptomycetaceae TaxID=2062 RepID=UPI001CCE140D|nr:sigma-70 family RNA polymerase sigma factor [Streptomyces sp. LS1784]
MEKAAGHGDDPKTERRPPDLEEGSAGRDRPAVSGARTHRFGFKVYGRARMREPFEKAVEQHGATVLRVCRALLGTHDADDAWSETFLAAMRAWPGLPETANVEAWLVTIARHKAIDVLRAAGRQPLPAEELPEAPSSLGVPGAEDGELWEMVGRLPGKQRQAVTFRYLAGMSYDEIAAVLGGNTVAARRAAADGLKNLRKHYPGATSRGAST